MTNYRERIKIPHNGDPNFKFFTKRGPKESDTFVAMGYERIVFGSRGPYIEFKKDQVIRNNIYIPRDAEWRLDEDQKDKIYYYEYRTKVDNVMIYLQNKIVDYADYKVGFVYISPFDLYDESGKVIIEKLRRRKSEDKNNSSIPRHRQKLCS